MTSINSISFRYIKLNILDISAPLIPATRAAIEDNTSIMIKTIMIITFYIESISDIATMLHVISKVLVKITGIIGNMP